MSDKKDKKNDSFLNEFQLEGKSKVSHTGKFAMEDWESALEITTKIATPERRENFHNVDWNTAEPTKMSSYCMDCRKIVTPELKTLRKGRVKKICSVCKSYKVASGREEALQKFYHIDEK